MRQNKDLWRAIAWAKHDEDSSQFRGIEKWLKGSEPVKINDAWRGVDQTP